MTNALKKKIYPTAIGSLPYRSAHTACEKIIRNFSDVPFWPQLVRRSFLENMYVQFSQHLPGAVVDTDEKRIYVNMADVRPEAIEAVYEKVLAEDVDFFAIGREYAEGLYECVEAIKKAKTKPRFLKGQVTGPVSFGMTVTDEKRRSIFYNTELKEVLVKILSLRTRWQVRKLKETGCDCIMFIDEPYLTAIGSSFVSLKKEEALAGINEVAQAAHAEGALCGMHCCGNTDWGFVLQSDIDIVSFDAYSFHESLSLYPKELQDFFAKGGFLAWGIIPNSEELFQKEDCHSLRARLEAALSALAKKGIKKESVLDAMLITPSCGLGLVSEGFAEQVMARTVEFADILRSRS